MRVWCVQHSSVFSTLTITFFLFIDIAPNYIDGIDIVVFYFEPLEDKSTIASPGANIESGIFPDDLTPVNWGISSDRKKAFFSKMKEIFVD